MTKPVTVMLYDMKPFLQSCVDRYVQLAGRDAKPMKRLQHHFTKNELLGLLPMNPKRRVYLLL